MRTGTSKGFEHAAAYFVLGLVLANAYARVKGSATYIAILLTGISGALELVQAWCPGRTPSVSDWLGGILGTSTAVLLHIGLKGLWGGHLEGQVRRASAVAAHHLQYWWRGE
jgi:VanZ family protein